MDHLGQKRKRDGIVFEMFIVGKASDFKEASKEGETYAGLFTLTYRGFNGDGHLEKRIIVLVDDRQVVFARKQAEKNYTLAVRAKGLRAWVDKTDQINLALEKVDLIIP